MGDQEAPSIIKDARTDDDVLLFTSYYKGNYGLYRLPMDEPVKEMTSAFAVVNVAGPKSRELLQKVSDSDLSHTGFPFGTCRIITVGYAPATAFRITYVGELGYELYIPSEFAGHVYETLWDAGENLDVKNAGYRVIGSTRLEKGYADWGSELSPEYTPYDAGLGFCVALDKKHFLGKDALVKIKNNGPKWQLCSFTIETDQPLMAQSSAPILYKGDVLGVATSSGYGHTIGKTICYGYIPADHTDYGEGFSVEIYKEIYPATCHTRRALYDPQRKKILR